MDSEITTTLIGVGATIAGTVLGWILNNLSNRGKLNIFTSFWKDSFEYNGSIGKMVACSKREEVECYTYKASFDIYNSSGNTKIMRNIRIVFNDGKNNIKSQIPQDTATAKYVCTMALYDNVKPINIPPKTVMKLDLNNVVWNSDDKLEFIWKTKKVYLVYIDEKNKIRRRLIKTEDYENFFEKHISEEKKMDNLKMHRLKGLNVSLKNHNKKKSTWYSDAVKKFKNMEKRMKKHKWIFIWGFISLLFLIVIHFLFHLDAPEWLQAKWTAGEILTYASTVSLGLLALWQNQKIQEEQNKKETYNLAVNKYALFDFKDLNVEFYNSKDHNVKRQGNIFEKGFNGSKAVWKFSSLEYSGIDTMKLCFSIKNIGNVPATQIFISDENGKKIDGTNVLSSADGTNDKRYILTNECGRLIISCSLNLPKEKFYYLRFTNPFGSEYTQKITIYADFYNVVKIDAQCQLNILENK